MNDIIIWSLIGMVLMALEVFGVQGIGILFTGFSAITVAFMVYLNPELIDNIGIQLVYFFFYTVVWAVVLWIPLNKFIRYSDNGDYSNIINTYATTNKDMVKGKIGEVYWSGTKVRAMIAEDNPDNEISINTSVKVSAVVDGLFYITNNIRKETAESDGKKISKIKPIT
jgi:membrane protein implicated in regulation of membrane protease activity